MAKKRKCEDTATWQQRVDEWKRSGLSVTEFARRKGLAASTWLKWRKVLGVQAETSRPVGVAAIETQVSAVSMLPVRAPKRERRSDAGAGLTFIELPSVAQARQSTDYGVPFELGLRSGRRLQVPASFDPEALERLVAILEGR